MWIPITLAAAWLSVVLSSTPSGAGDQPQPTPAARRPPIVLVSLDTLRADHVGAYGYPRGTTPHLDRLAGDAVLFENAFTAGGGTLPAHLTLLTSLPPPVHGVTVQSGAVLPDRYETLAEILGKAGYRTAAFTGAGYVRRRWGFDQGFETFDDAGHGFEEILPKATAWLDRPSDRPPFLFLHTLDIHSGRNKRPYDAPARFRARFVSENHANTFTGCRDHRCASGLLAWLNQQARAGKVDLETYFAPGEIGYITDLYDAAIAHADARVGDLVGILKERGLYDDAIIVVLSDHGEEFLDHGLLLHEQTYDEIARIPILLKLPHGRRGGTRVSGLVALMDILPTLLAISDVPAPPGILGTSLLPLIHGRAPGRPHVYVWGIPEKLRTARWSLLRQKDGTIELYDLRRDPGERNDVARAEPEMARALSKRLAAIKRSMAAARRARHATRRPTKLDEEVVRELETLGYLQGERPSLTRPEDRAGATR